MDGKEKLINEIVAVKRGINNEIVAFKLDNGEILDYPECGQRCMQGRILNADYVEGRYGMVVRSLADNNPDNNLQNLPNFF